MLKKSKLFVIAIAFVAVFAVASVASAADLGSSTLRKGSSGPYVVTLQTLLGVQADGAFGPMTEAAVKAWQASHGLVADGIVGPATKAAMNSASGVTPPPAGCQAGWVVNPMTGASCVTAQLPAGCLPGYLFSPTTGAKCDGGSTTGTTGPLVGGAGDIELSSTSTDVENEVVEGKSEKVLGFKVEAVDSDVSLSNLKITLENLKVEGTLTGSYRLTDYADTVSIYKGSTKVGEVDASDFTKKSSDTDHSNTYYTKSVSLNNAIVREGDKDTFYVVVEATSNLDSDDVGENNWEVTISDIRFQDATGVILTSTETENNTFEFTDLSNSGDVKLTISKGSGTPTAGNIEVSDSGSTKDVLMLEFKLKAKGSDMTFDEITFGLDGTMTGADAVNDLEDMLGELIIKNGSDEIGSESTFSATSADQNVTIDLDDTFTIDADSTETFRVYATINDVDNFTQGDSLKVSLGTTGIAAEDENGDEVTDESGSANGNAQTFYSEGISADSFTSTATASVDNGLTIKQTVKIKFDVTALGNDYYIPRNGLIIAVEDDNGDEITAGDVVVNSSSLSSSADEDNSYYLVSEGDTETFNVTVTLSSGTAAGFYHVQLSTLTYDTDTTAGGTSTYTFSPAGDFESDDVELDAAAS